MIAVYGGAFDPIHIGHLSVIYASLYYNDIDELHILPSYNHANKTNMSCFERRVEWLRKVVEAEKRERVVGSLIRFLFQLSKKICRKQICPFIL